MAYKRKTWEQKMHNGREAVIERIDKSFTDIPAGSKMLIATPEIVDEYIRNIPKGVHTSLQQMRKNLAATYHADYTCPITSGIFLRIVAENAYEQYQKGKPISTITPFWRMVDIKSPTLQKLSFGIDFVKQQWAKEGLNWYPAVRL